MVNTDKNQSLHHISRLILALLDNGSDKQIYLFFHRYHEADIAEALKALSLDQKISFFKKINIEYAADVIEVLNFEDQQELFQQFKTEQAAKYIEEMDKDDAADLLESLYEADEIHASDIIRALKPDDAQDLQTLLSYSESTAGAIMTSDFVQIPENLTVAEALEEFRRQNPPQDESSFYIYITSYNQKLVGYTSIRDLLMADGTLKVHDIRYENPVSVTVDMDQEDVARIIQKYNLSAVPVVNTYTSIVGIITVDDIVDVVIEEATEDIYKLSGTGDIREDRLLYGKLSFPVISRLPWLCLTIFAGTIASYIITIFSNVFSSTTITLALVLSFVPLLMGLAGNIGNQSSTIIVRGLSTGVISLSQAFKIVFRELLVGLTIGSILAGSFYFVLIFLNYTHVIALLIALSMVVTMFLATFIGSVLPLTFKRFGIDPAVASAPFISSTLDIVVQLVYFAITLQIVSRIVL